ncbi:MAG TPA: sodium:proton antiporter [Rhodospirillales bacterium]|jgi:CPA1 family monovalent cation:H+ antiporter|nr:sodium:proton antiporter [Rhodospirillales bacterium]|tara:strand:+ start:140 stop:1390 length:1251 start_codon:yes stop_codon:yes gene_type:complete
MSIFSIGAILVGLSALFGYINHRFLHLPHTIGLVVIALAASLSIIGFDLIQPSFHIGKQITGVLHQIDFNETLMHGMLSFLLFAGALHADFSSFRTRRLTIGVMACLGTLISTFVVGTVMWLLLGLFEIEFPFIWALVFGALISPTDPVAVLSLFKTVEVPDTLQAKMAGESLFNDGIGVVVFTVVVAIAVTDNGQGGNMGAIEIIQLFLTEAVGGAVLGLAAGYIGYRAMYGIDEPSLEVLISLALVMVTYALALSLHMSGPIAMVIAGLFIGNRGVKYAMSEQTREYVLTFWTLVDEILNSILFLLIGLEVLVVAESIDLLGIAFLAIPVTLFARSLSVTIPIAILSRWETFTKGAVPVLIWGGLRGGIAVALALSLPDNEYKAAILSITYGVVLFSIIVQGLTVKPLVKRMVG